jgi:hypothetical protein
MAGGVCIVCDGTKTWRDAPCWCCVDSLSGPRDPALPGQSRPIVPAPPSERCAYCGRAHDVEGDRLLRLAYSLPRDGRPYERPMVDGRVDRALVHGHCRAPWLAKQRDGEAPGKFWHVCAICGLAGPVDVPGEPYCSLHRARPALKAANRGGACAPWIFTQSSICDSASD